MTNKLTLGGLIAILGLFLLQIVVAVGPIIFIGWVIIKLMQHFGIV